MLDRLRVVAVTDRRMMGDTASSFAAAISRALEGCASGTVAVQVREKDLDGRALLALVRAAMDVCALVLVNDRLDVALAAGARGVHVPERGMAIADVRRIAPSMIVGVSRHAFPAAGSTPDAAAIAADAWRAGADLVQLGPIWPTPSKPGAPTLGLEALRMPRAGALVAVGGIDTPERARQAREAGASAVAVIRAAWRGSLAAFV